MVVAMQVIMLTTPPPIVRPLLPMLPQDLLIPIAMVLL